MLWKTFATAAIATHFGVSHAGLDKETLVVAVPSGFVVGHKAIKDKASIIEYIPQGETVEKWSSMVTMQRFVGLRLEFPVLHGKMSSIIERACPGVAVGPLNTLSDNGYAAAVWMTKCPTNPATGLPETTFFKAVASEGATYIVQKAYRSIASKEQSDSALDLLRKSTLCDASDKAHPCAGKDKF